MKAQQRKQATPPTGLLGDVIEASSDRRKFIKRVGLASTAAAVLLGTTPANAQVSDADILNFALNLEYLEAEFYTVATTGLTIEQSGIPVTGTGLQGPTTGGRKVIFDNSGSDRSQRAQFTPVTDNGRLERVAKELAFDEQAHVKLLRSALGSAAIAKPAINLDALGFGFNNHNEFLALARAFEDVGVTAYAGAAPLIASKEYLGTAARIHATEAEHAGNIRLQVAEANVATSKLDGVDILPRPRAACSSRSTTALSSKYGRQARSSTSSTASRPTRPWEDSSPTV